ncbi:Dynactin subunit p22, partial [Rhizoctonia solani]
MAYRNIGSVFLGDRVQHIQSPISHIPMSPPANGESAANQAEGSVDGHTDEVSSQVPDSEHPTEEEQENEHEQEHEKEHEQEQADDEQLDQDVELPAVEDREEVPLTAQPEPKDAPNLDMLLTPNPVSVSPELMLELRVRWLEALVLGIDKDGNVAVPREQDIAGGTVVRKLNQAQRSLDDVVKTNDGLRKFMGVYNQNARLLTPAFAHGLTPSETTSVSDLEALLLESEADIRAADRDLREIADLESRGVLNSGKLPSHEPLQPRVDALIQAHVEDLAKFDSLEERIGALISEYSSHVNGLSEIFVAWDLALAQAEATVTKLEKARKRAKETSFD